MNTNQPETGALIVVDMQNGFCHPDGSLPRLGLGLAGADAAVRNTATAVRQARRASIPVVFTRHQYRPGRADEGQRLSELSGDLAAVNGLAAGSWDADVVDELDCGPGSCGFASIAAVGDGFDVGRSPRPAPVRPAA
jgi:nicotinamidase-related amidase